MSGFRGLRAHLLLELRYRVQDVLDALSHSMSRCSYCSMVFWDARSGCFNLMPSSIYPAKRSTSYSCPMATALTVQGKHNSWLKALIKGVSMVLVAVVVTNGLQDALPPTATICYNSDDGWFQKPSEMNTCNISRPIVDRMLRGGRHSQPYGVVTCRLFTVQEQR